MPVHKGLLPREGLYADPIFKLIGRTALNPNIVWPLFLLARYTKKGHDLRTLFPNAYRRLRYLCWFTLARLVNNWLNDKVLNNWTKDKYQWASREVVLITGGAGGIGGKLVTLFAEMGTKVVVLDIQPAMTFAVPSNVHYFQCDITSTERLAAVAREIRQRVGNPTVLVNNAGIARGRTVLDASERDIRFTFDVNTLAHFWTTKEFLPDMVRNNHGMIVTVASYASYLTVPNMTDYGASKSAAYAFHEGITAELTTRYNAPKVRTLLVNQGYTKTALFTGYQQGAGFLLPPLEPETVADEIFKRILTGKSGQLVVPSTGSSLPLLRAFPHWYQVAFRAKSEKLMSSFNGRQVVKDLDKHYEDKEREATEESTVLVGDK